MVPSPVLRGARAERSTGVPRRAVRAGALLLALALVPVGLVARSAAATGPALSVTTSSLPGVEVGQPLDLQLGVTGGTGPYQWVPDSLPPGVTITSGGLLGGAATATGNQSLVVSVVDATNARVTVTYDLAVAPGPSITTTSLPAAQVGEPYAVSLGESGGAAPFTWSVAKGGLPGGFLLSSGGELSGRPGSAGTYSVVLGITDAAGSSSETTLSLTVTAPPPPAEGYVTVDAAGRTASVGLVSPSSFARRGGKAVGIAAEPSGAGYWVVNSAGRVAAFGRSSFYGSIGRSHLEGLAVGIAAPAGDVGYWIATSTGHVYAFGRLRSLGSVPSKELRAPIVGIASATAGRGYWLVTETGQVFAFGSAKASGSVPPRALEGRIVAIAASRATPGYLLVASTGRVYGFGGARPLPAVTGRPTVPVVGIAVTPPDAGAGYWLLTSYGGVYGFGAAANLPSSPPQPVTLPTGPVPAAAIAGAR